MSAQPGWRGKVHRARAFARWYIVGIETRPGRWFDIVVTVAIVIGVVELALLSVPRIEARLGNSLNGVEWIVGGLFILEYVLRVWVARSKTRYIFSFWGVLDAIAIAPFLIALFVPALDLTFLRLFRVMRIFSLLKLSQYSTASRTLLNSLIASRGKIGVFLVGVVIVILMEAFTIQTLEPETFPTVPDAIWWTIVTVTTVGYGDLVPVTVPGKFIAAIAMLTAFGIIAVPTGIVASEMGSDEVNGDRECSRCGKREHLAGARYCDRCAEVL